MSKFNKKVSNQIGGGIKTTTPTKTYEGGDAFNLDAKSELFLLAATNMVGENTFYEKASNRDERFRHLVHTVTKQDSEWVKNFIPFLRNELNMRSASIVAAAEYARAGGPGARDVVNSAMSRADEPGEFLAYWKSRSYPGPSGGVKRGLADAVNRLYKEYSALKYDGQGNDYRMGDVIELVHPKPTAPWQSDLYRYLVTVGKRGRKDGRFDLSNLPMIRRNFELSEVPVEARPLLSDPAALAEAGFTWERLSEWVQAPPDGQVWDAIIPNMGYMALLRNLRNFDNAGISQESVAYIQTKLSDPEAVAHSRQFPFRFWSAYKNVENVRWAPALESALNSSVRNIPELPGKNLVLIDVSGSMNVGVSDRGSILRWEIGSVFGAATALRSSADIVLFGTDNDKLGVGKGASILPTVNKVRQEVKTGRLGWGTNCWPALSRWYDGHDRVFIFTDMQVFPGYFGGNNRGYGRQQYDRNALDQIPHLYVFDLAGYGKSMIDVAKGRHLLGGFSDSTFKLIKLIEEFNGNRWPWEM